MYSQQESGWADGQLNENNERTDDLDGAAEGDNDTSRINVQNQAAPSRPRSRDSYYDRDRDMRDRGEPEYYASRSSRNHGGTEPRRRRNESYRDGRDRGRMDDYEYEYRDSRRARHVPERQYPDSYYMGGYGGGSRAGYGNPQQGIREMLERLRVQDPIRYREWYDQYQAHRRNPQRVPNPGLPVFGYGPPGPSMTPVGGYPYFPGVPSSNQSMSMYAEPSGVDRQSVHSGRSSVNELLSFSGIYTNGPSVNQTPSINQDPDAAGFKPIDPHYHKTPEPERMTPLKFNTSHCLGVLTPLGQLIKIKSQGSSVEIVQVKSLMAHLPEYKEVSAFPGPLVKGTTHKNTVIQFCQKKIKEAQQNDAQPDKQHFVLLWDLLILLLRQNGNVVGSDVAELLLKNQNTSADSSPSNEEYQSKESGSEEEEVGINGGGVNMLHPENESKITEKFCEFLLYGHKKDAVEFAMSNGLWGHALFLATKMDERTYGNVLARFANCTPFNHPIQTFYQLMSGRQPASAKSCCDDTFGDWKPHLAMILSNAGSRPEVEFKAIVKMGDTLGNKNHIFAAQFCYLMGQTDFSAQSKLGPLLGLSSSAENIIEATQMTEIYEFARSLAEPTFTLGPSFLNSKLNYTKTLLDLGFVEEAFAYCEEMVKKLKLLNGSQSEDLSILKWSILQIAERLVRVEESETGEDPRWISELRHDLNSTVSGGQVSDSQFVRRESVPDNQVVQTHDVPAGHEAPQDYEYREQVNPGYMPEYSNTDPTPITVSADQITSGMVSDNINSQPLNSHYDLQPPMYTPVQNQVPLQGAVNQQQPPMMDVNNLQNQRMDPQTYQPTQSMYPDQMMANNPPQPQIGDQGNNIEQLQYNPTQHMQPGFTPDYPNFPNNNYITPGGGYPMPSYGQPPPLSDGPQGLSTGANKKKSVRFEDDEKTEECEGGDYLSKKIKEIAMGDQANDQFAFCHPLKSSVRKHYVGYGSKEVKNAAKERTDILNFQSEKRLGLQLGQERRLNSDEIMEEIDRLSYSSPDDISYRQLGYRGTYPIDEPMPGPGSLNMHRPTSLGIKKTFPIDKLCCTENELCEDHDNFYNGSNSSSVATTPSGSSPKSQNSNGSLTGAGPNSFCEGKGYDYNQQNFPPQPPSKNQGDSQNKNQEKKDKSINKGGGDAKKQGGGFFSGIFSKFKGPNQMILPDDKDPPIVWDENQKKWVNKTGDEDEDSGPKGPPPSDRDLMGNPGMPPPMMSMPPQTQHMGGPPPLMQPMAHSQPNMMGQPSIPQQQPFHNQTLPVRPDSMSSASNVPLNAPGIQTQPIGNNYQQQNPNNFVEGYQNNNQSYTAAPLNNPSDPSMTGMGMGPSMNGPPTLGSNKYKLPRNRNIRSGYVDVLNPAANPVNTATNNRIGNGGVGGTMISPAGPPGVPNMFIPSPISGSGDSGPVSFLTPAPPGPLPAQSQLETN